jgi:Rod binding domain-containing protein
MTPIDPTSILGSEPLNLPPGLKLDTAEQQSLYRATLEFERVFVQQLMKPMDDAGKMLSDDESSNSTTGYQDLAKDQLTQAVLDGGGLGIATTLYTQLAEAAGIGATKLPAKAAPAAGTDAA